MNMTDVIAARALSRGLPTDDQTKAAVAEWLEDHPEATTTVEDGAISREKLDDTVGAAVDDVSSVKSAIDELEPIAELISGNNYRIIIKQTAS